MKNALLLGLQGASLAAKNILNQQSSEQTVDFCGNEFPPTFHVYPSAIRKLKNVMRRVRCQENNEGV